MRECSRGVGSRIQGRGALLRSLRALVRRVERFGHYRAATPAQRAWSITLADSLDLAFTQAVEDPVARASLAHAIRRAQVSRKWGPRPRTVLQVTSMDEQRNILVTGTAATAAPHRELPEAVIERLADLWCVALLANLRRHPIQMQRAS